MRKNITLKANGLLETGALGAVETRGTYKPINFFHGFDFARTIFCIFVVLLHSNVFDKKVISDHELIVAWVPSIADIVYFNIVMLAVPSFFLMSLFLYLTRYPFVKGYLSNRLKKILILYFFWSSLAIFYKYLKGIDVTIFFSSLKIIPATLVSGGFTIFYFFASLILLTIVLHLSTALLKRNSWHFILVFLLLVSLFMQALAPFVFSYYGLEFKHWNPINFLPYVYATFLIREAYNRGFMMYLSVCSFLLFVLFSFFDWTFQSVYIWNTYEGLILPPYARWSMVFGATSIISILTTVKRPTPSWVSFVSKSSLGVYCFHNFFTSNLFHSLGIGSTVLAFMATFSISLIATVIFQRISFLRTLV